MAKSAVLDKAIRMCDAGRAYSVSYKRGDGPYQSIGVVANSENEAISKAKNHLEKKRKRYYHRSFDW